MSDGFEKSLMSMTHIVRIHHGAYWPILLELCCMGWEYSKRKFNLKVGARRVFPIFLPKILYLNLNKSLKIKRFGNSKKIKIILLYLHVLVCKHINDSKIVKNKPIRLFNYIYFLTKTVQSEFEKLFYTLLSLN